MSTYVQVDFAFLFYCNLKVKVVSVNCYDVCNFEKNFKNYYVNHKYYIFYIHIKFI